jgi:hypothetical protein
MRHPGLWATALATWLLTASGCGSSDTVRVSGTLVKSGNPIHLEEDHWVQMSLVPMDSASTGEWFPANVEKDGSFDVPGKEGNGIPPGKYRVAVTWVTHTDRNHDLLHGALRRDTSPIIREITGSGSLTIDLVAIDNSPDAAPLAVETAKKKPRPRQGLPSD